MKATCSDGSTYLFAKLESKPSDNTAANHTCYPNWDEGPYQMNYVKKVAN